MNNLRDYRGRIVRLTEERRKQGDYLEVTFEKKLGFFRQTKNDAVMEKVDDKGNILGFSVMNISKLTKKPLQVSLL